MKTILIIFLACTISFHLFSQEGGDKSIGLRIFNVPGVSFKKYTEDGKAYEAMFSLQDNSIRLTALKEIDFNVDLFTDEVRGFAFYYGYGAHAGAKWRAIRLFDFGEKGTSSSSPAVFAGLDGILGMEYLLHDYPVTLSLDMIPSCDLEFPFGFKLYNNVSLSIRYKF